MSDPEPRKTDSRVYNMDEMVNEVGWGGRRPGAGQPRKFKGPTQTIYVKVEQRHIKKLELLMKKKRLKFIGDAVREAIDRLPG